ncbi:MAG: protoporphyrinogen oxidase HemJ [Gammaproteobacteria bacterium]|nr:protoporphyrinogen oxidase HemJ [Gammaproteobacteria bacterium]
MYLWLKAFHVIFMVTWFAGLFYLPRLFVYHSMASDSIGLARFKIMERKLFYGITTPAGIATILCGMWLIGILGHEWLRKAHWLHLKLCLVALLIAYHLYLGKLVSIFANDQNQHSHVFYRWLNELPVAILIAAVVLAVVKPL